MSIDYQLALAGDIPLERLSELAAPGATETLSPAGNRLMSADLYDENGYGVSIVPGDHGYYEAESDGGEVWSWEPDRFVDITFHMGKDTMAEKGVPNMLKAVAAVLSDRSEDAALTLNSNWLLLTRNDGVLRRHRPDWWSHHDLDGKAMRP
ncbi:SitI3 family protein [Micromonospora sp. NPDC094482]|uniref:SitI3 family protein n=1 Tax=unclassified Micromonospora TaxID=2617518 RepID=UPI00331BC5F5